MTTAKTGSNPRCRYCGQRRQAALAALRTRDPGRAYPDDAICPLDGHRYPPAPPDCRGCAGACIVCEQEGAPLPCPECGWAG